jgi:hypothetical protein
VSRFSFGPKASGETQRYVLGDRPTFSGLVELPDLSTEYRNRNKWLMEFLTRPETVSELFRILKTTTDRAIHKKIIPLFQTGTMDLFLPFARDLTLTREAYDILDERTSQAAYGVGSISRMVSRALDRWALDCLDLFRASHLTERPLIESVLSHLDKGVVYQTIADVLNEQHEEGVLLMWYIFRAIAAGFDVKPAEKPRRVFLAPTSTARGSRGRPRTRSAASTSCASGCCFRSRGWTTSSC